MLIFILLFINFQLFAFDFSMLLSLNEVAKLNGYLANEQTKNALKKAIQKDPLFNSLAIILEANNPELSAKDFIDLLKNADATELNTEMNEIQKNNIVLFFEDIISGQRKPINVLLVGRTRVGKSTLASTLADPLSKNLFEKNTKWSSFSHTINASSQVFMVKDADDNFHLVNIIDTPGFFEQKAKKEESRSNDEIADNIQKAISNKKISDTFLVVSATSLRPEDINSIPLINGILKNHTQDRNPNVKIILSHAEIYTKPTLDKLVLEYKKMTTEKNLDINNESIFFTGTIFGTEYSFEDLLKICNRVTSFRNSLLKEITGKNFNLSCDKKKLESLNLAKSFDDDWDWLSPENQLIEEKVQTLDLASYKNGDLIEVGYKKTIKLPFRSPQNENAMVDRMRPAWNIGNSVYFSTNTNRVVKFTTAKELKNVDEIEANKIAGELKVGPIFYDAWLTIANNELYVVMEMQNIGGTFPKGKYRKNGNDIYDFFAERFKQRKEGETYFFDRIFEILYILAMNKVSYSDLHWGNIMSPSTDDGISSYELGEIKLVDFDLAEIHETPSQAAKTTLASNYVQDFIAKFSQLPNSKKSKKTLKILKQLYDLAK